MGCGSVEVIVGIFGVFEVMCGRGKGRRCRRCDRRWIVEM